MQHPTTAQPVLDSWRTSSRQRISGEQPVPNKKPLAARYGRVGALIVVTALAWLLSIAWSSASAQERPVPSEVLVNWGCNGDTGYVIFTVTNPASSVRSYELRLIDDDSGVQIVQTPARNLTVSPLGTQQVLFEGLYNYAELKPRAWAGGQPLDPGSLPNEFDLYCRAASFGPRGACGADGRGEIFTYSGSEQGFEIDIDDMATIYVPPTGYGDKTPLAKDVADGVYRVRARSGGQEIYIGDLTIECDFEVEVRPTCINLQRFVEVSLRPEFLTGGTGVRVTSDEPGFVDQNKYVRLRAGELTTARFSNQAAVPSKISVFVDGRAVDVDETLDFACEQVEEPVVEIDRICEDSPFGSVPGFDVYARAATAGIFGVALLDDGAGLLVATASPIGAGGQSISRLGFSNDGEPLLAAGEEYDIVWSWNGVSGGHVIVEAPSCDEPPPPPPPLAEVQATAECMFVRGRIDVYITNESGPVSDFVARLNRAGAPVRSVRLSPGGNASTLTWTGRADGTYLVTVERDGAPIYSGEVVVDCTPLPDSEVTVTQSCFLGRGRFDVVLYNDGDPLGPNNGVRDYVVTVGRILRERSVTATEGPVRVIVTGRPTDVPILVTVDRPGLGTIYLEEFKVTCDER